MADHGDDKLSREVAIAATLEENGVRLKTKSRAVAALDSLVGAMLDAPAAFLEGIAGKKRLRDSIDEQLKRAQAAAAEAQIAGRPELGSVLIDAVLIDRARKQKNAAGVAIEAVEAMKALPPPDSAESETNASNDEPLDEDWMNMFIRFAEDASSDQLQQLWGRVLAGEVRKRGCYSQQTLRFVAELDGETARNCEWIASFVIGRDWVAKGEDWNSGADIIRLHDLQRVGILGGVGGIGAGPNRQLKIAKDGTALFTQGKNGLFVWGDADKIISVGAYIVTRLGQEVLSLLPTDPDGKGLRRLSNLLEKSPDIRKAAIGEVSDVGGGRWHMPNPEELWEK